MKIEMEHNELCPQVLELIPQVRFSGVLNSRGDLDVESNRDDSGKLLSADEEEFKLEMDEYLEELESKGNSSLIKKKNQKLTKKNSKIFNLLLFQFLLNYF